MPLWPQWSLYLCSREERAPNDGPASGIYKERYAHCSELQGLQFAFTHLHKLLARSFGATPTNAGQLVDLLLGEKEITLRFHLDSGVAQGSEYFSECFSMDAIGMALCGNGSQEIYTE